ncbi:pyridoxal phosphate-dependent decarboxylase family protein [Chitinophaga nivalis]|uniref:Aspartate aminotransferase family protein n=1 Tax=Chitinophaga nivalis TaxID=2991709 RepID=A0ABT3IQ50_9BACT|nr:aspartate aminotransferase family protein [Chitinophaga nivalis]MCW3464206.1 aspartate aminotransferase family protein [Chitinophaga nivalis]MCW3486104.1 aspartate aminotransferase family protein [Chitinophaga nivalis]
MNPQTLRNTLPVTASDTDESLFRDIFYEGTLEEYLTALGAAGERVAGFLRNNVHPFSGIRPATLLASFKEVDFDTPLPDYDALLDEVQQLYIQHATAFHLPQYIAHLNCPVLIPALAAEVIISAINSSQDTYDQSAGGTFMERRLIDWTGEQIGYSQQCDGVFTAGGSQSNLMGLLLARDYYAVHHLHHNIKLYGCPPEAGRFRIFVSEKAHFSNHKNAGILGLGEKSIVSIPTDTRFRMDAVQLETAIRQELAQGNIPIAIVATAGTTDFGNIDPLQEIARIAREYSIWYHIDAAYGCGLLLTDKYRHLLHGAEQADSITIDYHKSFFQPISSSAFIVKDKLHLNLIKHHADYLNPPEQDYDALPAQINKSIIQSTRRFDALKLWCTLRLMGREKLGKYTEIIIETTQQAAVLIAADPEFDLLSDSDLGILVFRYHPAQTAIDLCALNQYIKQSLFFNGEIIVASTKVKGAFYLKFTILNPLTTLTHIREILAAIKVQGDNWLQQPGNIAV